MFYSNRAEFMVKESFDNLPTGLIYAKTSGLIILANKKMYDIYEYLTGEVLQSAYAFWDSLNTEKEGVSRVEESENITLIFDNKTVYTFKMNEIDMNNEKIIQIEAINITDLYHLRLELREKNQKAKEIKEKMIATKNNLEQIINEEEMLDAKLKIHNTMGTGLASIRRYVSTGEGDLEKSLNIWRKSIMLLNKEASFYDLSEFDSLMDAAKSVGIDLEFKGEMPKDKTISKAIIWVCRECIINAVVHGDAKKMVVDFFENVDGYRVSFCNDGQCENKEIKEGGGFASIRRTLKDLRGEIEVEMDKHFVLRIYLPKWE